MKCPVCYGEMVQTDNLCIFRCKEKRIWSPQVRTVTGLKVQTHLFVTHSVIYFNPDTGKQELKVIEITPYVFRICDYDNDNSMGPLQRTEIAERVIVNHAFGEIGTGEQELLVLPTALDLPWHDTEQVFEKIKMYMLFS